MATITSLPEEVISIILGYKDITIEDIINFRCVCKQFRYAANYPKYMEKKFSQRWPFLKAYCNILLSREKYESEKQIINFKELGINYTRKLREYVSQMKYMHYHNESIDNYVTFEHIFDLRDHLRRCNYEKLIHFDRRFTKFSFYNDELKSFLTHSSQRTDCDLTERYYYEKLFNSMKKHYLNLMLDEYNIKFSRKPVMEWIAFYVAQTLQIQKDVSYLYIVESLDNIAKEVYNFLKEEHPDHSIFSTSPKTFYDWKHNNLDDNQWNEAEGIQIIDALNEYIFGKLNFRPCKVTDTNLEYMCINNVLKSRCGQDIILLIIYHSVARRLGLRSDIIGFGDGSDLFHCIYWKSRYGTDNPENERCFSLIFKKFPDCLVNKLLYWKNLQHLYCDDSLPRESFGRISSSELQNQIMLTVADLTYNYNNISQIMQRNRTYSVYECGYNIKRLRLKKAGQFVRTEDVKFGVGMIVTHRVECSNCDGVIIGWDRHTDRRYEILNKLLSNGRYSTVNYTIEIDFLPLNHCHNYEFREKQTNYIILTDNNKICYVNEDQLTLAAPKWIDNFEIGRYFRKFENTHYVPNEMLTKLYPQDVEMLSNRC